MKRIIVNIVVLLFIASIALAQSGDQPTVIRSIRNDKSPALRELAKNILPPQPGEPRIIPLRRSPFESQVTTPFGFDPALQDQMGTLFSSIPIANWEGISDQDNSNILGSAFAPPDLSMDVGPNHVVQMLNIVFAIWNKQGDLLLGPLSNDVLWAGFGGPCQNDNSGDPIVLYDHLADRWILSQFAVSSGNSVCYAVSETGDPTGAYYRYEFQFADFPDYPKLGVWPDAYYATFRVFGNNFDMVAGAMERDSMLVGAPAQMVLFSMTNRLSGIDGVAPVDLDGPPPPDGTPGFFMGFQDSQNRLFTFDFSVDWDTTANSTFVGPNFLSVNPFSSNLCGNSRDCIPQPGIGDGLATISFAIMHRLAFRDFGTHMAMVANHTVDVDGFDHAGIRWYELRDEGAGWIVYQQGTYAPDSDHRWMGSISMDPIGNIALAYSVSSSTTFPAIRYAGHSAGSTLGIMNIAEVSIFEGTGSQIGSGNRWGDYTSLMPDPSADGTFWLTNEYYATTSSFNWNTRIAAFILNSNFLNIAVSPSFAVPGIDSVFVTATVLDTTGLSLFARFESPNGSPIDTIQLFNDGAHFDGAAGDSIFANAWLVPAVEERFYNADLLIIVIDGDTTNFEIGNFGRFTTIGPVVIETVTLLADTVQGIPDRLIFNLKLRNDGLTVTAENMNAKISTADSCIASIVEGISGYGDIAPGTSANSISTYIIDLNGNCKGDEDILFDLSIASGTVDFWTDSFTIQPRVVRSVTALPSFVASEVDSVVLTSRAIASAGLNLSAVIETSDKTPIDTLTLFDDGAHHDGEANDSLFGNAWSVPNLEQKHYLVKLQVTIAKTDIINFDIDNAAAFTRIGPVVNESITFLVDTIPNPGDNILFKMILRNNGSATITEVSADISTIDTCVTNIIQNKPTYGDINAGESAVTIGAYRVDIDENCAEGKQIMFDVSIASNGINFWVDDLTISLIITGIVNDGIAIPVEYALGQNYPNPFNPTTIIRYALPKTGMTSLVIYNLRGQEVTRLIDGEKIAGFHSVIWDGRNLSSGIYFYRLRAGGYVQTRKMVLLK